MAERDLMYLHTTMRGLTRRWLDACSADGLSVLVYCTLRTPEEQAVLYRIHRSAEQVERGVRRLMALGLERQARVLAEAAPQVGGPGPRATNALPGLSFHQAHFLESEWGALALDFVPIVAGRPRWKDAALYERAAALAEGVGLTWSGRWATFHETAHLQYDRGGGLKILALAQGAYAGG